MYDLGIIGGMGPKATNIALSRIIDYTYAKCDQEHISIIVLNNTKIPDRTSAILNNENDVLNILAEEFNTLEKLNVPVIIATCNTSHYFIRKLNTNSIIFVDAIEETKNYINNTYKEKIFCVLGTTGLVSADVFCKNNERGNLFYPDIVNQKNIMDIINQIKSGLDAAFVAEKMLKIMNKIQDENKNIIFILACTELSILRDFLYASYKCVDCLDVLVTRAICKCGYKINDIPGQYLSNINYFADELKI